MKMTRLNQSSQSVFTLMSLLMAFALSMPAHAQLAGEVSVDPFTNSDSEHKTEVEPDTFAWGNTIVSAFHVGRRPGSIGWGSADVGLRLRPMAA